MQVTCFGEAQCRQLKKSYMKHKVMKGEKKFRALTKTYRHFLCDLCEEIDKDRTCRKRTIRFQHVFHFMMLLIQNEKASATTVLAEMKADKRFHGPDSVSKASMLKKRNSLPVDIFKGILDAHLSFFQENFPQRRLHGRYRILAVDGTSKLIPAKVRESERYAIQYARGNIHGCCIMNGIYDVKNKLPLFLDLFRSETEGLDYYIENHALAGDVFVCDRFYFSFARIQELRKRHCYGVFRLKKNTKIYSKAKEAPHGILHLAFDGDGEPSDGRLRRDRERFLGSRK